MESRAKIQKRDAPFSSSQEVYVDDRLKLINGWDTKSIHSVEHEIKFQIREKLYAQNPVLATMTEVKIVTNPRRNVINLRVLPMYQTLIYYEEYESDYYCYFLSDKFEPFAIITLVSGMTGDRVVSISAKQASFMLQTIGRFKDKYGIKGESYHYTGLDERLETHSEKGPTHTKSHSKSFHVKMRISKSMLQERMPINRLLNVEKLCENYEPVQYAFTRKTVSLEELKTALAEETGRIGSLDVLFPAKGPVVIKPTGIIQRHKDKLAATKSLHSSCETSGT